VGAARPTDFRFLTSGPQTAASSGPLDFAAIAAGFRQDKRIEPKVRAVLVALTRMGFLATPDGGKTARHRTERLEMYRRYRLASSQWRGRPCPRCRPRRQVPPHRDLPKGRCRLRRQAGRDAAPLVNTVSISEQSRGGGITPHPPVEPVLGPACGRTRGPTPPDRAGGKLSPIEGEVKPQILMRREVNRALLATAFAFAAGAPGTE